MKRFLRRAGEVVGATTQRVRQPHLGRRSNKAGSSRGGGGGSLPAPGAVADLVDLQRRRDQLGVRLAELQWDLGGLVYEMAIRDSIRVEVIVRRAAELQNVDAELNEVERILKLEQTATAGECATCGAPHSSGAVFCWQCGSTLLPQVPTEAIGSPTARQTAATDSPTVRQTAATDSPTVSQTGP